MVSSEHTFLICATVLIGALIMRPLFMPVEVAVAYSQTPPSQVPPKAIPLAIGNCTLAVQSQQDESLPKTALLVCIIPGINDTIVTLDKMRPITINAYAAIPVTPVDMVEQHKHMIVFIEWTFIVLAIVGAITAAVVASVLFLMKQCGPRHGCCG